MPNRTLIVSMLLPAYVLLVLHSVIPHHHHAPAHHGPVQYHHGSHVHHTSDDHHHGDTHDEHGHGPTSHFVHSPDFGNAMLRSDADLTVEAPVPHLLNEMMFSLENWSAVSLIQPALYVSIQMTDDGKVGRQFERGPPHV